MARLVDGSAADATPLERALVALARKSVERPRELSPVDLDPLRALPGNAALEYAQVLVSFHHVNRIADLLHVDAEAIPYALRGFARIRRLGVLVAGVILRRMDLENRRSDLDLETTLARFAASAPELGASVVRAALEPLSSRPALIESLRLGREELGAGVALPPATIARILNAVEDALPRGRRDLEGFHARPADPVDAFAFVGTRYAQRTTRDMIDALRRAGHDDLAILDLAIVVAEANAWARLRRVFTLEPKLLSRFA